jgi:hypothetical protein
MARAVWNTINSRAVWRALHAPGAPVSRFVQDLAEDTKDRAEALAPVNDVRNALHRGGVVGTYKRSFTVQSFRAGSNQHATRRIVANTAKHADIVESGRPYVRRRQVFTWKHAQGGQYADQQWRKKNPGKKPSRADAEQWYRVSTKQTRARKGQKVLERAVRSVARDYGVRRSLRLR